MNTAEVDCLDGGNLYPQTHTYCTLSSITFRLNKTATSGTVLHTLWTTPQRMVHKLYTCIVRNFTVIVIYANNLPELCFLNLLQLLVLLRL